jgi:hypothetical protein
MEPEVLLVMVISVGGPMRLLPEPLPPGLLPFGVVPPEPGVPLSQDKNIKVSARKHIIKIE